MITYWEDLEDMEGGGRSSMEPAEGGGRRKRMSRRISELSGKFEEGGKRVNSQS